MDQAQAAGEAMLRSLPPAFRDGYEPAAEVRYLRPPGALPEAAFLDACTRCGDCLRACPAQCIVVEHVPADQPPTASAFPHIVARRSPCVVCDERACMTVCPTGALTLVRDSRDIRMGRAAVDHDRCLLSAGEPCELCVSRCPVGDAALIINDGDAVEVLDGCIGCGVCEHACPTEPPSIIVHPPPE